MNDRPSVELFSIGTEIVWGLTQDTNTYWLSQQVVRLGGDVQRITKVKDDLRVIVSALRESVTRGTEVVITTGGLGPTDDDLTTKALGELTGAPLVLSETVLHDYMKRRNLLMREEVPLPLRRMATVPAGADLKLNPVGWAPSLRVHVGGTVLFALPGPPREMEPLFVLHVVPYLSERCRRKAVSRRVLVSIPRESLLAPHLNSLMEQFSGCYLKARLGATPKEGWLPVDIVAVGDDEKNAQHLLEQLLAEFERRLHADGERLAPYPHDSTEPFVRPSDAPTYE